MVSRISPLHSRALAFVLLVVIFITLAAGCGGGSTSIGGGSTPPGSTPTPTPAPGFAGVSLKVGDATVPPGGIFQYQLLLTEPKPIGNTSTRPGVPGGRVGPLRGVAVNDASGKAMGGVVVDAAGNPTVKIISPNVTLGTDISYPLFTMTRPVN